MSDPAWPAHSAHSASRPQPRPPIRSIHWQNCWHLVPSRFPPCQAFARLAEDDDLAALSELEAMTNNRLRDERGEIRLISSQDRAHGPGSDMIMAAFTHFNPCGSRFSDGQYGVFYVAAELPTAIAETKYHRERFMRATHQAPMELDLRVFTLELNASLHDIRDLQDQLPEVYHPYRYDAAQSYARELHDNGSLGIVYDSLRQPGGECAALFRPRLLSQCRAERHLCFIWDGSSISTVYEKRLYPQ